jgi:hypothetical protein
VQISIELDHRLERVLASLTPKREVLQRSLVREIADLLQTLGIPGVPAITITELQQPLPRDRFLRLHTDNRLCGCTDELVRSTYSYHIREHVDASLSLAAILDGVLGSPRDDLVSFLTLVCVNSLKTRPARLLGAVELEAYLASLPAPPEDRAMTDAWPPDAASLSTVLARVLDLGLSIGDQTRVVEVLAANAGRQAEHAVEALVAALAPEAIEIHVPADYLHELTTARQHDPAILFPYLREGMFSELGVVYPPFRLVLADRLKPRSFTFSLGALQTPPVLGLPPDRCFVNGTVDDMRAFGIDAIAMTNPALATPGSQIHVDSESAARNAGFTTWDNLEHLILCLAAALRARSGVFVHRDAVRRQLDILAMAFPALVAAVLMRFSIEHITSLLRALVAERIPIRNLRLIVERLVDANDKNADELVSFVRAGMAHEIKQLYARRTDTVVVYLLEPTIEKMIEKAGGADLADEDRLRILQAIDDELRSLPATAQMPAILTTTTARAAFQRSIVDEFPRLAVIGYDDLPLDANVQPVSRISLA